MSRLGSRIAPATILMAQPAAAEPQPLRGPESERIMRTREIEREQWPFFLGDFSHLHHGEHVNVETMGRHCHDVKPKWADLPLVGIIGAEPAMADNWIEIIAGHSPGAASTHTITHPSRVVIAEQENGHSVALQIDSEDGRITMLRFEPSRENMPVGFVVS